jgi:flagellar basal body P-ring formation protein FlgA
MKIFDFIKILLSIIASTGCLLLLAATAKAYASDTDVESHEAIRLAAEGFAAGQADPNAVTQASAGNLDPRLRLPKCAQPLEAFAPHGRQANSARITVGVRCHAPKTWTLYVPVALSSFNEAITITRNLERGSIITERDIGRVPTDTAKLTQGYFVAPEEVVGKQTKRPIRSGDILTPSAIESARLINNGDSVTLLAKTAGIHVKMRGQALRNGALGDYIDVKNLSSKRIIRGKIIGQGEVEIVP